MRSDTVEDRRDIFDLNDCFEFENLLNTKKVVNELKIARRTENNSDGDDDKNELELGGKDTLNKLVSTITKHNDNDALLQEEIRGYYY